MNTHKGLWSILLIILALIIIGGGLYIFKTKDTVTESQDFILAGTWKFEEVSKESSINGITSPGWEYTLSIDTDNQTKGTLHIDGYQTMTRLNITVGMLNDSANIFLDSYADGNQFEEYKKGDVLMTISPDSEGHLMIDWYAMQPNVEESKLSAIFVRQDEMTTNDVVGLKADDTNMPSAPISSETAQNQFIDPGKNFSFLHTFNIIDEETENYIAKLTNVSGDYPEDVIYVSYTREDIFKDDDAKMGPFQLRYNQNEKCWETYSESSKGNLTGVVFSCATPTLYTDSGLPVFTSTLRWRTYVVPIETNEFVRFNITGSGATKPLDDIIRSVTKL